MSPSHFNRAFKSVFGSAPGEFVETLRVNEAKRRLSGPNRILETIAASIGFSDAQTFRRAFERKLGAKPRSYLKNFNASSTAVLMDSDQLGHWPREPATFRLSPHHQRLTQDLASRGLERLLQLTNATRHGKLFSVTKNNNVLTFHHRLQLLDASDIHDG
jgi:hypothetical protein